MTDLAPLDRSDHREWLRQIARQLNLGLNGACRTVGEVTLRASQTTTTVSSPYVTEASHINLTPLTANAAADFPSCYISDRTNEVSFTITHPSDGDTDKSFSYEIKNP